MHNIIPHGNARKFPGNHFSLGLVKKPFQHSPHNVIALAERLQTHDILVKMADDVTLCSIIFQFHSNDSAQTLWVGFLCLQVCTELPDTTFKMIYFPKCCQIMCTSNDIAHVAEATQEIHFRCPILPYVNKHCNHVPHALPCFCTVCAVPKCIFIKFCRI